MVLAPQILNFSLTSNALILAAKFENLKDKNILYLAL